MDGRGETDALPVMVTERLLQVTEKASGARDTEQHAAKLPQKLLPFGEGDTFLVGRHRGEDFQEAFHSVWREGNGLLNGVDEPAEDDFTGGPTTVTFQELLNRDGLLPVWTVSCVQWAKYSVDGREEDAAKALPAERAPLGQANGIIDKDIEGTKGFPGKAPTGATPEGRHRHRGPMGIGGFRRGRVLIRGWGRVGHGVQPVGGWVCAVRLLVGEVHKGLGRGTEIGR